MMVVPVGMRTSKSTVGPSQSSQEYSVVAKDTTIAKVGGFVTKCVITDDCVIDVRRLHVIQRVVLVVYSTNEVEFRV